MAPAKIDAAPASSGRDSLATQCTCAITARYDLTSVGERGKSGSLRRDRSSGMIDNCPLLYFS
eukprot:8893169-Pyramimonas_sp.AAC.1